MPVSPASPVLEVAGARQDLSARFAAVRQCSRNLARPLTAEDAMVQSMADASPAKWHLAHTTWFFERFVLARDPGHASLHPDWDVLFNSYYQSVGPMHARPRRGLLSRPTLAQVLDYRDAVDASVARRLEQGAFDDEALQVLLLGLHHEQQHQELLLTDIKHAFWSNPLGPAYRDDLVHVCGEARTPAWTWHDEAIVRIGAPPWPPSADFAYDNESPVHRVLVAAHAIADRPVCNAEFAAFVEATEHVTDAEWEQAARPAPVAGNLLERGALHPQAADAGGGQQWFGDVWEWTASAYAAYPGFTPWPGSLGEYNGKFMSGQCVLRGGSCATPRTHLRASYRNFFPPHARWQFSGVRLAKDPA